MARRPTNRAGATAQRARPFPIKTLQGPRRQRREAAWTELVAYFQPRLWLALRYKVESDADREDVLALAWFKAAQSIQRYGGTGAPGQMYLWLLRIAERTAHDWKRAERRRRGLDEKLRLQHALYYDPSDVDVEHEMLRRLDDGKVRAQLFTVLNPRQQAFVTYRVDDELEMNEIQGKMGFDNLAKAWNEWYKIRKILGKEWQRLSAMPRHITP